jgi:hypothetical protein
VIAESARGFASAPGGDRLAAKEKADKNAGGGLGKGGPRTGSVDDLLEGALSSGSAGRAAAPRVVSAEAPAAAKPAPVHKKAAVAEADSAPPPPASAPATTAAAPAPPPPAPSLDELVRRADRLFAEHRWEEATTAYTELLRRYPSADAAPRWRARVVEARRARLAAEQPAAAPAEAAPAGESEGSAPASAKASKR